MASTKRSDKDEGVVTSAPGGLGSLLTDLLSEVKTSVEKEQKQKVDTETERRAQEETDKREIEEARRREEAQRKLIEEARRRNEELGKVREPDRKSASTARHARPVVEQPMTGPRSAEVKVAAPRGASKILTAALVLLGVGAGFGTAFALQPEQRGAFLDVNAAAKTTLAVVSRMAQAETKFTGDLTRLKNDMSTLEKRISDANDAQTKLKADNATLQAELVKAQKIAAAAGETKPTGPTGPKHNGTATTGVPTLNNGLFTSPTPRNK